MQATRVLRAGSDALINNARPHLVKVWKSYTYTKNQRVQQLSPFELDVTGPLFRNVAEKIRHKVEDNVWDVAPPLLFFIGLVSFVQWKRADIVHHHRD